MMGRLKRDQEQLFYSFRLEEAVPDDHLVRSIAAVRVLDIVEQLLYIKGKVFNVLISFVAVLLQRLANDPLQFHRCIRQ